MEEASSARLEKSPWQLLRQTVGGPREAAAKLRRLGKALAAYGDGAGLHERLERLAALGYLTRTPTRLQLIVGAVDMLRFWIVPAAEDYYRKKGISFTFHQLLRFLDDPASIVDPTGFLSERDVIIGHLMQVVHANPCYDFQLLESFADGLDELERQLVAMLAKSHPRSASIGAIVEEPGYHARLLEYLRQYRQDRDAPPLLRENVVADSRFAALEQTFGTLPGAMRYFTDLPETPLGAIGHLLAVREFPG